MFKKESKGVRACLVVVKQSVRPENLKAVRYKEKLQHNWSFIRDETLNTRIHETNSKWISNTGFFTGYAFLLGLT
jgi:hypothetical protein